MPQVAPSRSDVSGRLQRRLIAAAAVVSLFSTCAAAHAQLVLPGTLPPPRPPLAAAATPQPAAPQPAASAPAVRPAPLATATPAVGAPASAAPPAPRLGPADRVRGGMVDASDVLRLAHLMRDAGYEADPRTGDGDPAILGRIARSDYAVQFYECERGSVCHSIQFALAVAAPPSATLEALNAFNARWRYVRAVRVGADIRLLMDVNLDAGVTSDNFIDTLDVWRQLVETFERDVLGYPASR